MESDPIVVVVAQGHQLVTDLPQLEVDLVVPFSAGVVIEAGDECLDGEVGEGEALHGPVDGDRLGVAHAPHVGPVVGVTGRLDGSPAVAFQRIVEQVHGHAALLAGRGGVVGVRRHADGDGVVHLFQT